MHTHTHTRTQHTHTQHTTHHTQHIPHYTHTHMHAHLLKEDVTDQISELVVANVETLQLSQTAKGLGQSLQVVLTNLQDLQLHQPDTDTHTQQG